MDDAHTIIPDARVLVRGGKIMAIWTGPAPPSGVIVGQPAVISASADDLLFPGLINLHSHPFFNHLHTWPTPSSHAIPSEGKAGPDPYANRYQWGGSAPENAPSEYDRLVGNPAFVLGETWGLNLTGEIIKYAEVAALLGGETALQGGGDPESDGVLIRNVDDDPFGLGDRVQDRVPSILKMTNADAAFLKLAMTLGELDAWLVHLAEGVPDEALRPGDTFHSRHEFDVLRRLGLLTDMTVIIHGAALESADFSAMRAAPTIRMDELGDGRGAKLVWSPLSNLLLYGLTANVYEAYDADVLTSLGTDWSPSGSRTLLQELKIADIAMRDPRILGASRELVPEFALKGKDPVQRAGAEAAIDRALVDMVTRNPALTLRWYDRVGSVEVGKVADLLLVRRPSADDGAAPPTVYRELINATERDVRLVLVGGDPLAGDAAFMAQLKDGDYEIVTSAHGGFEKTVDVTKANVPGGDETLAELTAELEAGLGALGGDSPGSPATTYSYLKCHIFSCGDRVDTDDVAFKTYLGSHVGYRPDGSLNLEAVQLAPLFAADDDFLGYVLHATIDRSGLIADPTPPFELYPANFNQVMPRGNPFADWSADGP